MHRLITPRIRKILLSLSVLFLLLCVRLVFVQLGAAKPLSKLALDQYKTFICLLPKRGVIYDRNLKELAISINLNSIYLDPLLVEDKASAAQNLSKTLGLITDEILNKLN